MPGERESRLEALFLAAREDRAASRPGGLLETPEADEALRREAEDLLAADEAAGDFLNEPALDVLAREIAREGTSLRPGERVGAYVVAGWLGSGGGGEVWRAFDERLGRDVAIKVLHPLFATDESQVRRFELEARAAGGLRHRNILTVHDVGVHRGTPFLVTEFLEGELLRDRLERGPLRAGEAAPIALQVARGLAAAHAQGIVHRDVKPENVFVTADGDVKVLDFGLATLDPAGSGRRGAGETDEPAGVVFGTIGYMSPEHARGEDVGPSGDVFALGAVLFEMLTGRLPFAGSDRTGTLEALSRADPPGPADLPADVPKPLARLVLRCLERSPAARFESAADVVEALEAAVRDLQTAAHLWQILHRPGVRVFAGLLAVALLAAAIFFVAG